MIGRMLFWLSDKILDVPKYPGLYQSALSMDTDLARTVLAIHLCPETDFTKTALQGGFLSYDFENSEGFELNERVVRPASKLAVQEQLSSPLFCQQSPMYTETRCCRLA